VKDLFGEVGTVATKEGIGNAALCLHPEVAADKIRSGVKESLQNLGKYKPYKIQPPYTLVLRLFKEEWINEGSYFPGVKRTGDWELTYKSNDIMDIINTFRWLY